MGVNNSIKPSHTFYFFLAFLEGGAVMAIELTASRMVAPMYGSALMIWAILLGVAISGLAAGYYLGGRLADNANNKNILFRLLLIAAMLMIIMPKTAAFLTMELPSDKILISAFFASLIIIFPALLLFGATTPIIIRLCSVMVSQSGNVSGKVYGISTIGGILFTFLVGFWIVPEFGLKAASYSIGILIGIIPAFMLIRNNSYLMPLGFAALAFVFLMQRDSKPKGGIRILHRSEGLLGQLLAVDAPTGYAEGYDRILFVNRMGQTWVDVSTGASAWSYVNYLISAGSVLPEKPEVLLLGLGGGTIARHLQAQLGARVDAVELDERIAALAQSLFGLSNEANIIIDDARHYIKTTQKKYDLVIFDVFKGEVAPAHVLTIEAFNEIKKKLNPNALVIINFNGFITGKEGKAGRSVIKTLKEAGYIVKILPTHEEEKQRNILYLASLEDIDFNNTRVKLNLNNEPVNIPDLFLPDQKNDLTDAVVLTDDKPVLELLNMKASESWRIDYSNNFTKVYSQKGIPVFK